MFFFTFLYRRVVNKFLCKIYLVFVELINTNVPRNPCLKVFVLLMIGMDHVEGLGYEIQCRNLSGGYCYLFIYSAYKHAHVHVGDQVIKHGWYFLTHW